MWDGRLTAPHPFNHLFTVFGTITLQPDNTVMIVGGPVNADYCTWWKMKVGDVEGWAQGIKYWFDAAE